MMRRGWPALLLLSALLVGCGAVGAGVLQGEPIDARLALLLLPRKAELHAVDPLQLRSVQTLSLQRMALDYVQAPNGKFYLPLHENPGDHAAFIAILDPKTGRLEKRPSPVRAMTLITATSDGTLFVRSGSMQGEESLVLMMDSRRDQIIGTIPLPGAVHRMSPYSDSEALVPVTSPGGQGGNLYVIGPELAAPKPLFPFALEPFAPFQVIIKPGSTTAYFLYNGLPPGDITRRAELAPGLSDPRLLEAHIDIWDIETFQLQRRLFLPLPSAQHMVRGPDGRLYVSHIDMSGSGYIDQISVVDPEVGSVEGLKTVKNPLMLQIMGQYLYVSSALEPVVDIFGLPDLRRVGRVGLD